MYDMASNQKYELPVVSVGNTMGLNCVCADGLVAGQRTEKHRQIRGAIQTHDSSVGVVENNNTPHTARPLFSAQTYKHIKFYK